MESFLAAKSPYIINNIMKCTLKSWLNSAVYRVLYFGAWVRGDKSELRCKYLGSRILVGPWKKPDQRKKKQGSGGEKIPMEKQKPGAK